MFKKLSELEEDDDKYHNQKNNNESITLPKPGSLNIPQGERLQPKKLQADTQKTFGEISKELITKKSVFNEFIGFVKNGFKLKE